ncbi:DJ-1/PfpI family protein [Sphingorhabdus lacus]|uniref:DJ-1/PfpI family protein n=1 Tax=Sphingorhabdus lacus TaxID=392610 RepID=UPI0035934069
MTKKVLLLLADGFEPLEAAGFTDVFGWAALEGNEPIELVSASFKPVLRSTFGLRVMPQAQVSELDLNDFDALAIPGGFARAGFYDEALSEPFLAVIRHFNAQDRDIASVCVASLALGAAGIIAGHRATIYHQLGGKRKDQLEQYGALFVDQAVVEDGHLISSTGPGTSVEVALRLLANLTSPQNAAHIRAKMRVPELDQEWLKRPQV